MSVSVPRGFVAAGGHVGIKSDGVADCAIVACTTPAPRGGRGRLHDEPRRRPRRSSSPRAHLAAHGRSRPGDRRHLGQRERRDRRARASRAPRPVRDGGAPPSGRRPRRCSSPRPGSSASRSTSRAVAPARSGPSARPRRDAGARRGGVDRDARRRTPVARPSPRTSARSASARWPRVRRCSRPTSRRCSRSSRPTRRASPGCSASCCATRCGRPSTGSTSTVPPRPTTPSWCSRRGSPVRSRPSVLGGALAEACASLARQMVDDAEGATRTATVDRARRRPATTRPTSAARAVAGSLLVKCSLNGADPYWGRVVSELGAAGVAFRLDRVAVRYGGVAVCVDGGGRRPRHGGGRARTWPVATSRSRATSGSGRAWARCSAATSDRGTSTRTGRPRERRRASPTRATSRRSWSRRCRTSGGSPARSSSSSSAARRSRAPRIPPRRSPSFAEDVALLALGRPRPGRRARRGTPDRRAARAARASRASSATASASRTPRRSRSRGWSSWARSTASSSLRSTSTGPSRWAISGFDANLLRVELRDEALGFVGDVDSVDPTLLHALLAQGLVPVIATMGSDTLGQAYNVNADMAAGALAAVAARDEARRAHRRRRHPARRGGPRLSRRRSSLRRARGDGAPRHRRRRDGAKGTRLRRRGPRGRGRRAPPRRPRPARAARRAVHGRRGRHDGDGPARGIGGDR